MFINFTNHPSKLWEKEQRDASLCYGDIIDLPFPNIDPMASKENIREEAARCVKRILSYNPDFVLCQGEFTLAYHVIRLLKENHITVGAACSKRQVTEKHGDTGNEKTVLFHFIQYREY